MKNITCMLFKIISVLFLTLGLPTYFVLASEPAEIIVSTIPAETAYEQESYFIFRDFGSNVGGQPLPAPVINDSGDVMFYASLGGPVGASDTGLYLNTVAGVKRQIARRFTNLPGYSLGTAVSDFTSSLLTRNADAVVKLTLGGSNVLQGINSDGIWRSTPVSFLELERSGSLAPQTNPVAYFIPFSGSIASTFEPLIIKNQNTDIVAIPVNVSVSTPASTQHGVWIPEVQNPLRVMTSYPAPGIPNTTLTTVEMTNRTDGPVVYRGTLSGSGVENITIGSTSVVNDVAVWSDVGGVNPVLVARKGQTVSDGLSIFVLNSIFGDSYRKPIGTEDGSVLLTGNIINALSGASAGTGLFRTTGNGLEQVFRTGQSIINAPGFTFDTVPTGTTDQIFLDCDGSSILTGSVAGPGVTHLNSSALIQETLSGPVIIARARQQAPGVPAGTIFTTNSLFGKRVCSADGNFAFAAQLQGSGVTSSNDKGVWFVQDGQTELIFREGMQIGNQVIVEITNNADHIQVSDSGRVLIRVDLAPDIHAARNAAIISWSQCEGATILTKIGSPVLLETGMSTSVVYFSSRVDDMMNNNGEVVMALKFAGGAVPDQKIVKFPAPQCNPPCPADFDDNGTADVSDIFAFLSAWFSGSTEADFDNSGTNDVPDIFAFLSAWFVGC